MIDSSFVAKCNTKWSTCSASPGGYTKDIYCCSGLLYNSLTSVNAAAACCLWLFAPTTSNTSKLQPLNVKRGFISDSFFFLWNHWSAVPEQWFLLSIVVGIYIHRSFWSFKTVSLSLCMDSYKQKIREANSSGFVWCQAQMTRRVKLSWAEFSCVEMSQVEQSQSEWSWVLLDELVQWG